MRIGQLSEQSGVKLETIRYYERVGLMPPPPRTPAGYRQYRPDHLRRLVFLRHSPQLGFSSKEVRDLLSLSSQPDRVCKDITRLAAQHLRAVKVKIDELRRLQRALEKLIRVCPGRARIVDCGILESLTRGEPDLSVPSPKAGRHRTRTGLSRVPQSRRTKRAAERNQRKLLF